MKRLDTERQKELEPKRMDFAIEELAKINIQCFHRDSKKIKFLFKGKEVTFYPYSGWHTGKSINDGRGLKTLLDQLK